VTETRAGKSNSSNARIKYEKRNRRGGQTTKKPSENPESNGEQTRGAKPKKRRAMARKKGVRQGESGKEPPQVIK